MSREKQIEEMAKVIAKIQCNAKGCEDCEFYQFECDDLQHYTKVAELLNAEGYRKASDVAEEIFAAVDAAIDLICAMTGFDITIFGKYAELKKKYSVTDTNVGCKDTEGGE